MIAELVTAFVPIFIALVVVAYRTGQVVTKLVELERRANELDERIGRIEHMVRGLTMRKER